MQRVTARNVDVEQYPPPRGTNLRMIVLVGRAEPRGGHQPAHVVAIARWELFCCSPIAAGGSGDELRALRCARLGQEVLDVLLDRPDGQDEALGDLAVGQPVGEELQDLHFTSGDVVAGERGRYRWSGCTAGHGFADTAEQASACCRDGGVSVVAEVCFVLV